MFFCDVWTEVFGVLVSVGRYPEELHLLFYWPPLPILEECCYSPRHELSACKCPINSWNITEQSMPKWDLFKTFCIENAKCSLLSRSPRFSWLLFAIHQECQSSTGETHSADFISATALDCEQRSLASKVWRAAVQPVN